MVPWTIWVVLGMFVVITPVRPRTVEMVQMLVGEPIHRVNQDSSPGIQKIRILVESDESRIIEAPTVLPLSIESAFYSHNDDRNSFDRDTQSKRQVHVARTTPKPQSKATTKPPTVVVKSSQSVELSSSKSGAQIGRNETRHVTNSKPNVRVEPKPNQFGIGSTVVVTVDDSDEPTYVDQTQPQKLAKPLRYESERVVTTQKSSIQNQWPAHEEKPVAQTKSDGYIRYEDVLPLQQSHAQSRPVPNERKPDVRPVYIEPVSNVKEVVRNPYYEERPILQEQRRPERIQPSNSNNRQEEEEEEYAGFPDSFQVSPPQSRPLQNDPALGFPPSPCPEVFRYVGAEPGKDSWEGEIYLETDFVLIGIRIDLLLDRPAQLMGNWLSDMESADNQEFTILSLKKRLTPGVVETVRFLVRFSPEEPVPILQRILLNGRKICPVSQGIQYPSATTPPRVYEKPVEVNRNPVNNFDRPVYEPPREPIRRPSDPYEQPLTSGTIRPPNRRPPTTEAYDPPPPRNTRPPPIQRPDASPIQRPDQSPIQRPGSPSIQRPDPNPNFYEEPKENRIPTPPPRPLTTSVAAPTYADDNIVCGKPAVQPRPLVSHGQSTARGQWPWHAALYKNIGVDLSYICGGSLISKRHVITAAHCVTVTYDTKPLEPNVFVVYLGKYHLRLWSEGGVQTKQVIEVNVHPQYNNTDFRADLAVLVLSSPVQFTEFIRPVCLWDSRRTSIEEVQNKEGTVIGWGFDESKRLTEELMQAKMPVIKHTECLWSYPDFFPKFTSNYTYCAGFRNGTSVCNGDSGGGMFFPYRTQEAEQQWFLRGLVSLSVTDKDKSCDTKHYVIFTDIAKYLDWLENFIS